MYPPENPERPRSESVKNLITLIEELILIVQENGGVIKRDEANRIAAQRFGISSQEINYAEVNGVADKFLEYSLRSNEYTLGERAK